MQGSKKGWFETTHWSLVLAAGDSSDPRGRDALSQLCRAYWPPVYSYVRSRGRGAEEARDLTQGFFATLLEKGYLKDARRERGRFRSFLLASVKHYLANEWDRERAQRRGGGVELIPLDVETAESHCRLEPADRETPETVYEKRWALTVVEQVLCRLESEMERSGNAERFRRFRPMLTDEGGGTTYRELGNELGMSESAVKVAVHRLRRRFGELLRDEVAHTVDRPDQVDAEIRHLLDVMGS